MSTDASVRWPTEGVDTEKAARAVEEFMEVTPRARCDACHGAGAPPSWATDPAGIVSVSFEKLVEVAEKRFAQRTLRFEADGAAHLHLEPMALFGQKDLEPGEAERLGAADVGTLDSDAWRALADAVAGSGLFRYEGEAISTWQTHGDPYFVFVERRDHDECIVGSMIWPKDEAHRTFGRVIDAIEAAAARVDWQPAPR